ncbi:hypothetical protein [Bifidobacterium aerophilum]|uniref:Uncharacterized protein n=1 Tax=Bifidobacterium aerophilum TaxID=1798155 RepID=A0A6N9Z7M3_9BIFI|nr:hypothetical protein [Bifidobacterium aerophilum]NEG90618.1 hypothetical protein [Bifidobacterium aerophilum]
MGDQYHSDGVILVIVGLVTEAGGLLTYKNRNNEQTQDEATRLVFYPIMMIIFTLIIARDNEIRRLVYDAMLFYMLTEQAHDTWGLWIDIYGSSSLKAKNSDNETAHATRDSHGVSSPEDISCEHERKNAHTV